MDMQQNASHWPAYLEFAFGILVEVVAMTQGMQWLTLVSAFLFWLAVVDFTKGWDRRKSFVRGVAAIVLICGAGLFIWLISPRVAVNPSVLRFDVKVPLETFSFNIKNNKTIDIYSVQLKVTFDPPAQYEEFSYGISLASRKPIIEGSKTADIGGIRCPDSSGSSIAIFDVYKMQPDESREIILTRNRNSPAVVRGQIIYHTTEPQPRIGDVSKRAYSFHIDEYMDCTRGQSIYFWLDPDHPPTSSEVETSVERR